MNEIANLGKAAQAFARARASIPGGVTSGVRAGELPQPLFIERAEGASMWDIDGNHYLDYVMGQGPMLLGHSPAAVIERVEQQLHTGILFGGSHLAEVELAERLIQIIPCAEAVRLNVTGTEADQVAVRLARAATGRSLVLKFEGHYHGWSDALLANVASPPTSSTTASLQVKAESAGIPASAQESLRVVPWNDADAATRAFEAFGDQLAAVIMEPVMGNSATIVADPGYLAHVRGLCDRYGVVLIFDEIITGFRLALGGAQERLGVTPDLAVFGKAMANGFPISCVVGKRELFAGVEDGSVTYAGTFNGSPIAVAACLATLDVLEAAANGVYAGIETQGSRLMAGLRQIMSTRGTPFVVAGLPPFFGLVPAAAAPRDHADVANSDGARLRGLLPHLVLNGVRISWRGTFFPSAAHDAAVIDETLERFSRAWEHFVDEEER